MSLFHYLTIGYFDPKRIYPWGKLEISRMLDESDLRKLHQHCPPGLDFKKPLNKFLQPDGTLFFDWMPSRIQNQVEMLAEIAHTKLGMSAADVRHGRVIYPASFRLHADGTFHHLAQNLTLEPREHWIYVLRCLAALTGNKKDRYLVVCQAIKALDLLPDEQLIVDELNQKFRASGG